MKGNILLLTLLFCGNIILSDKLYGQYANQEEISEVVQAESISKEKLYNNAKRWTLEKFMTADNIVEFDDENKETILVTGHILMAKHKYLQGLMGYIVNTDRNTLTFKMRIDLKDNRFKYTISNIQYSFNKIGGPSQGYCQTPLRSIENMPDKKVAEVHEEANEKLGALITELKSKVAYNSGNEDW